jgi:hypothetical protein
MGDAVSLVERLRVLVVCMALEMGVITGVPMRPDEIRALMHHMNQPRLADVLPIENDQGDDPPDSLI